MVEEPLPHVTGLVFSPPRAPLGLLQQQRGLPQRSGRRRPHLEHQVQEDDARVHFPLSKCGYVGEVREVSPEFDSGGYLFGADCALG